MKVLSNFAIALGSVASLHAASVTYYSDSQLVSVNYSSFNVQKFDSSLGALTGVRVFVESELDGSFTVATQYSESLLSMDGALTVKGDTGSGFTQGVSSIFDVVTTPDWATASLPGDYIPVEFTIASGQDYQGPYMDQTISSAYYSFYLGGTGETVLFQARNVPSITTNGVSYQVNAQNAGANTRYAVEYTYTPADPIPEPSVLGLAGAFGLLALLRRRR
jgi:hypothetical protein